MYYNLWLKLQYQNFEYFILLKFNKHLGTYLSKIDSKNKYVRKTIIITFN